MRTDTATITHLSDYRASDYLIDTVDLDVSLHETATKVRARLTLRPNPIGVAGAALVLDGDDLSLVSLALNDISLAEDAYDVTPQRLTIPSPPAGAFSLTIETQLDPSANTKLMGLYRTGGVYSTQCEADGFRRIVYFLDRPDVMSVYTTRIEADRDEAPVLLGNGNPVLADAVPGTNRHFAVWHDPHPKPAYLFALVGGPLAKIEEDYVTAEGLPVKLAIYVQEGKQDRAAYAMDSLVRCMRWDERVFGRNYDLDVFNVVAVPDFNMGAMENKGLNIFNDKYVLASPETATDQDYANIEAIIAHEYFHNWTGNRITCRDWFQLCLKEGLTVFRDQEFSSDERSRPVKRIADVRTLRTAQFTEDAGPLAHPVRPSAYKEINNFYTPTVYEKGAEVIRMLKAVIGANAFVRGMNLYFASYDGTAATIENFLSCFAESSGQDLTQFARWYAQAGTPRVMASGRYDSSANTYVLDLAQTTPPTPEQASKEPVVIPMALALFDEKGTKIAINRVDGGSIVDGVYVFSERSTKLTFHNISSRPLPSLMRGFSAPVKLEIDVSPTDMITLFRCDDDPFNRWQASQKAALDLMVSAAAGDKNMTGAKALAKAFGSFVREDARQDPAYAAQVLMLPSEGDISREIARDLDPDAILAARRWLRGLIGKELTESLVSLRKDLEISAPYSPDAISAGRRALRNAALDLIIAGDANLGARIAAEQTAHADNMTDRLAALIAISQVPGQTREDAIHEFAERFSTDPLVLDKWLALQASIAETQTLDRVRNLMSHTAFSLTNPNRIRSLIGAFAQGNPTQFNRADGAGYNFVADIILDLDTKNPQVAARLLGAFKTWRMLEPKRQMLAEAALKRVKAAPNLSRDVTDIIERTLA
jgi:aminopeptidase N